MEYITYNTSHRLSKIIDAPSQEDIYNCPHYFGMSFDQVKSAGAPSFLIKLLDQFPFDGRKNVLQIRPQDFRAGHLPVDGMHWHTDYNVRLLKKGGVGEVRAYAKDHDEFHLMVISWGAGYKTQFIDTPMNLPNNLVNNGRYWADWKNALDDELARKEVKLLTADKNRMVEYTGRDIHRADGVLDGYGLRLMIVAFDCDDIDGNERILPTLRQLDQQNQI